MKQELDRVANTTEFNGLKLLNGTFSAQSFQVGANANQTISFTIAGASTTHLANNYVSAVNATADFGTSATANPNAAPPAANVIAAQTLSISGTLGSTTAAILAGDSAFTVASKVNAVEGSTGVTATATNSAILNLSLIHI